MEETISKYSSFLRSTPPDLTSSATNAWPSLADLRGAALPCLLLMAAFPQAMKSEWLSQASGYGRDSILHGLNGLAGYGLASYDSSERAWVLTELGAQFSLQLAGLFKLDIVNIENSEVERTQQPSSENIVRGDFFIQSWSGYRGMLERYFPSLPEKQAALEENMHFHPENQEAGDNLMHVQPENQGTVDKSGFPRLAHPEQVVNKFFSCPENQDAVDNYLCYCPENQGDGERFFPNRPENQGAARALSLKEVKEEESIKINQESSSRLTSRLTSRPPPKPVQPDEVGQDDDADLVARLLQDSASLMGEPLLGSPADYPDTRRLLAVISEVYDNRHKLRKPARVAYVNYHRGHQPDLKYWDATHRYLPEEFHRQVGLPYRNPYLDWATPAETRRYEDW